MNTKIALLGASKGLGLAVQKLLLAEPKNEVLVVSRTQGLRYDFSKELDWKLISDAIEKFRPNKIWYFAGGGPYGSFLSKEWKDHDWAFNVTFRFPAFLLHTLFRQPTKFEQWIAVGSSIAENQPDPGAASYCAAKHALIGLISTIQLEQPKGDVRLFSPGYMDTGMLPPGASPRKDGSVIQSPSLVAQEFVNWAANDSYRNSNWSPGSLQNNISS